MEQLLAYIITAIGFVCFIEALPWLIAPKKMQNFLQELLEIEPEYLRYFGIALLAMAVFLVWLGEKFLR